MSTKCRMRGRTVFLIQVLLFLQMDIWNCISSNSLGILPGTRTFSLCSTASDALYSKYLYSATPAKGPTTSQVSIAALLLASRNHGTLPRGPQSTASHPRNAINILRQLVVTGCRPIPKARGLVPNIVGYSDSHESRYPLLNPVA